MDNQHKKIKGYRDLTPYEVELMNRVKERGNELQALIYEINSLRTAQASSLTHPRHAEDTIDGLSLEQVYESGRCINRAEDSLKTGIMWLVRSVALPDSF